jgi:S1-C subfamily serine protease
MLSGCSCAAIQYKTQDIVEIGTRSSVYIETAGGRCTGFSIDYNIIVTAAHCVAGSEATIIYLADKYIGTVLVDDEASDIAIIKVNAYFPKLAISNSILKPGQLLVGIGYPFYANGSITFNVGFLKNFGDDIIVAEGVCYRGMSGGPILDEFGQVVGLCSRIGAAIDIYNDQFAHSHVDLNLIVPIRLIIEKYQNL